MTRSFADAAKRKPITAPEISVIFNRQLKAISPNYDYEQNSRNHKYKSYMTAWLSKFGVCEFSGEKINGQPTDWEHKIPLGLLREGDPIKWQIILRKWHPAKTAQDVKDIARSKRRSGLTGQYNRRATRKANGKQPLLQSRSDFPQGRKLQSRGFPKKGAYKSNVRHDT